jgi:hypothetical protein
LTLSLNNKGQAKVIEATIASLIIIGAVAIGSAMVKDVSILSLKQKESNEKLAYNILTTLIRGNVIENVIFQPSSIGSEQTAYWQYRRPITIDNTQNSNNLSNYQVLVVLDTASLISAGKMRSDGGDIRFTDSDGKTQLSYWIESGVNSANTRVWVKVPFIPASSTKTIYLYYGNPSATSVSDSVAVFGKAVSLVYGRDNYYLSLVLTSKEWISGGKSLGITGDDKGKSINLPFPVIVYGTSVSAVYLSTNGLLRWDNVADTRYNNFLDTSKKILTAHWDDLIVSRQIRKDAGIYEITGSDVLGQYVAYRWATTYNYSKNTPADFEILLYKNGHIQFNILELGSGATPNEYISRGDSTNYIDLTTRWSYMESILFVPRVFPEPTISIGSEQTTSSKLSLSNIRSGWEWQMNVILSSLVPPNFFYNLTVYNYTYSVTPGKVLNITGKVQLNKVKISNIGESFSTMSIVSSADVTYTNKRLQVIELHLEIYQP